MNCYSRLNRGVAFHLSGEFLTSLLASKSNQESISILGTRVQTKLQKNCESWKPNESPSEIPHPPSSLQGGNSLMLSSPYIFFNQHVIGKTFKPPTQEQAWKKGRGKHLFKDSILVFPTCHILSCFSLKLAPMLQEVAVIINNYFHLSSFLLSYLTFYLLSPYCAV